jgi:hypothetical protein
MIAVAVRKHAQLQFRMLVSHVFDRVHDDIGISV